MRCNDNEICTRLTFFTASIFGLVFAAFAEIGKTYLVFICNAVSHTLSLSMELFTNFVRLLQYLAFVYYCFRDSHQMGVEDLMRGEMLRTPEQLNKMSTKSRDTDLIPRLNV